MFGLAVIIPAVLVFYLTYRNAANLAAANDAATLRVFNKGFALAVFERLQMARSTLERMPLAADWSKGSAFGPMFTEVEELAAPGTGGSGAVPTPEGTLLILRKGAERPRIAVIAIREYSGQRKLLRGTLDPNFIWGDPEAAISDGRICVRSGNMELACVGVAAPDSHGQIQRDRWDLVLKPEFGVPAWRFSAEKPWRGSFASYAGLLLPVAGGLLLLALLLSSIEIRRILVPLEALLAKIAAMGGGRAVNVRGGDEFVTLNRTFQSMESRIGRQILMLETLQQIDQLILARVPLARVVELVAERVRTIVGARPVAISLFSPAADVSTRHFSQGPEGGLAPRFGDSGDPVAGGADSIRHHAHGWQAAGPGPGLQEFQLATVWCLTVGQDIGPWVRLTLGQFSSETGHELPAQYDEHGELEELAGRVAVALAAEAHETRLVHQARHDLLTDLPNRLAVFEMLPDIIRRAQQSAHSFTTLFVDLDRFKAINDGLGHVLGDSVLVEVARRIRRAVGPDSVVSRLGGDEFLVIAPKAGDPVAALSIDTAIRQEFKQPVLIEGRSLFIDFTAGIAIYPGDGDDPLKLMHNADLAMYRAKRLGGGRAMLFDAQMNQAAAKRVQMENDLRIAITAGHLHLHYQPRIDSRDGSIVGAEALVRWNHPAEGEVGPGDFIGLAEECGLIGAIGAFVIDSACQQVAAWRSAGLDPPLIAVNVSPHQLRSGDLFDTIANALATHGIDWCQLEIEITESLLVKDSVFASEQLRRLREAGCTVAIDDFGTGYSSLAYLANLPTDTIKIDRSFIGAIHAPGTQAVVRSIIALGQTLGKTLVAEGVERPEDLALLNSWGCHIVQGYVYFPPLAPHALAQLLPATQSHEVRLGESGIVSD